MALPSQFDEGRRQKSPGAARRHFNLGQIEGAGGGQRIGVRCLPVVVLNSIYTVSARSLRDPRKHHRAEIYSAGMNGSAVRRRNRARNRGAITHATGAERMALAPITQGIRFIAKADNGVEAPG